MIGALIMVHGDDRGLVLPPKLAPVQVVLVPIWKNDEQRAGVLEQATALTGDWNKTFRFHLDDRDTQTPGWKFSEWELKGVPIRVELGPKDIAQQSAVVVRRDTREKIVVAWDDLATTVAELLETIQRDMLTAARAFQESRTHRIDDYATFRERFAEENFFALAHWCGDQAIEDQIKEETKATIAVMPFDTIAEPGPCMVTGKPCTERVVFAKSY